MNPITPAAIDSCSIFLPLQLLESYNTELDNSQALLTLETGEIDVSSIKQKADITIRSNGYSTYYKRKLSNRGYKHATDGIAISITSKHLRERYSEGITNNTIETLHANLMLEGQIEITLDNFKLGMLSDVDVKQDITLPDAYIDFNDLTAEFNSLAKKQVFGELPLVKHYKSKTNQGINFGSRSMSNVIPHFKIYNKLVELEHHSNDFKRAYNPSITHPVRLEVNLKNTKHLLKYKVLKKDQKPTLENCLTNLTNFSMEPIMTLYIDFTATASIDDQLAEKQELVKQTKMEIQAMKLTQRMYNLGHDVNEIIETMLYVLSPRKRDAAELTYLVKETYETLTPKLSRASSITSLFKVS